MSKKKMFFGGSTDLNGLTSYWKFNGNSNDEIGTNNGTDTNINYSAGLIGLTSGFNNPGVSYITIPDAENLSFDGDFSIVSLQRLTSLSGNPRVFGKRTTSTDWEYILLYTSNRRMGLRDNLTSTVITCDTTDTIPLNTWYVSTITFNSSTKTLKHYVDKNLNNVNSSTSGYVGMENTNAPLVIGIDGIDFASGQLAGAMNALGIYKGKELTALEVEANVDKFLIDNEHLI